MKLSKVQKETLDKMEEGKWYSVYNLQASLNTLDALKRRGLVKREYRQGYMFFPRNQIKYMKVKK